MSAALALSALGALALTSGIALTAAQPAAAGDGHPLSDDAEISAEEREQAFAAMREHAGRP